jgi:hypothetical protein
MEVGTGMMQSFAPVKQIDMHLSGFAFYNGQPDRQVPDVNAPCFEGAQLTRCVCRVSCVVFV